MIRWFLATAVAVGLSFPIAAHAQDTEGGLPAPAGAVTATATVTDADSRTGTTGALPGYSRHNKAGVIWFSRGGDYAQPGPYMPKLGETGRKEQEQIKDHKNDYLVTDGPLSGVIRKLKGNAHVVVIVQYDLNDPAYYNKNVTVKAIVGTAKKQVDVTDQTTGTTHTVSKGDELLITGVDGDKYTAVISPDRGLSSETARITCEIPIKDVRLSSPGDPIKTIGRGLSFVGRAIGGTAVRAKDDTKDELIDAGQAFVQLGQDLEAAGREIKDEVVTAAKEVKKDGEIVGLEVAAESTGFANKIATAVADKTGRAHTKLEKKLDQVKNDQ